MGSYFSQLLHENALQGSKAPLRIQGSSSKLKKEEKEYVEAIAKSLPHLCALYISSCKLKQIPDNLRQLEQLEVLGLEDTPLKTLPPTISSLAKLERLLLAHNNFQTFPEIVLQVSALTVLDLSHNGLTSLPDALGHCQNLRELYLSHCNFGGEFPSSILSLRLAVLDLAYSKIGAALPSVFDGRMKKSLRKLIIAGNGIQSLASLEQLDILAYLDASSNQLDQFPSHELVACAAALKFLNLAHNKIVQLPGVALSKMTNLEILKLNDNRMLVVPKVISSLVSLKEFHLQENSIHKLTKRIDACQLLEKLALEFNALTRLPTTIKTLARLSHLTLHNNRFRTLPEGLYHPPFLSHIFTLTIENPELSEELATGIREAGSTLNYVLHQELLLTREELLQTTLPSSGQSSTASTTQSRGTLVGSSSTGNVPGASPPALTPEGRPMSKDTNSGPPSGKGRPKLVRLASQYGTMRGPPGGGGPEAGPPPNVRNLFPGPFPGEGERRSVSPQPTKSGRFASHAHQRASTDISGLLQPRLSLSMTSPLPAISEPTAPASAGQSPGGGPAASPVQVLTMPQFAKFKEAFEALVDSIDLSAAKSEELKKSSTEEKWNLLKLYKGQLLGMLANSEEKLARDKRFDEWQKRDKKVQQLVNHPPTFFIQSLSELNISMADMNSLRALLDSAPLPWVYQFIDSGGILALAKMLEFLILKKTKLAEDAVRESTGISVFYSMSKMNATRHALFNAPPFIRTLTFCLLSEEIGTRIYAVEMLRSATAMQPMAPKIIESTLTEIKQLSASNSAAAPAKPEENAAAKALGSPPTKPKLQRGLSAKNIVFQHPFDLLIHILRHPRISDTVGVKEGALLLIGQLVDSRVDIIERFQLRKELLVTVGLHAALEALSNSTSPEMHRQLQAWAEASAREEQQVMTLAATDFRVLQKLQEKPFPTLPSKSSTATASPEKSATAAAADANGATGSKPNRRKAMSVSGTMGVMRQIKESRKQAELAAAATGPSGGSLAPPGAAKKLGASGSAYTSAANLAGAAGKKVIKVLVSDVSTLQFIYTDTTTVQDVLHKIFQRHEIAQPDLYGLFIVAADRKLGKLEGQWLKDKTAKVAEVIASSADGVVSFKMMPWNITVEAPSLHISITAEVEPSWTVGQMCAHLCSLAPSALSLEEEYDIFVKPSKDTPLSQGPRLESGATLSAAGEQILQTKTLLLFQHAEQTKVYIGSGENQVVLADLDPRWITSEVIAHLVELCKGQLPQFSPVGGHPAASPLVASDYGLLVEPKRSASNSRGPKRKSMKKVYKRGSQPRHSRNTSLTTSDPGMNKSASATSLDSAITQIPQPPQITKPTWLSESDVLLASGWDSKSHRLRITLRPREVQVYLPPPPVTPASVVLAASSSGSAIASASPTNSDSSLTSSPVNSLVKLVILEEEHENSSEEEPKKDTEGPKKSSTSEEAKKDTDERKKSTAEDEPQKSVENITAPKKSTEESASASEEESESAGVKLPVITTYIGQQELSGSGSNTPTTPAGTEEPASSIPIVRSSSKTNTASRRGSSRRSSAGANAPATGASTSLSPSTSATSLASSPSASAIATAALAANFTVATLITASPNPDGSVDLVISVSFELPASFLIKEVLRLAGRDQQQAATYSLYSSNEDKLLSRRKTLLEAGVMPGDKLSLKLELSSIKLLENESSRNRESVVISSFDEIERAFESGGLGSSAGTPPTGSPASAAASLAIPLLSSGGSPLASSTDGSLGEDGDAPIADVEVYDEPNEPEGKYEKFEKDGSYYAATLNKLIMHLTDPDVYDKDFLECFLLTYRSFATPSVILQKLIQRYRAPPGVVPQEKVDTIRVRVMVFLTNWLDKYYQEPDERVIEQINIWAETEVDPGRRPILLKTLNRVRERKVEYEMLPPVHMTFKKKVGTPKLIDLDPSDIARQLTLDLAQIYVKIKPIELFDLAWTKPKLKHLAPNVLAMIDRFNYYSNWAITEILSESSLKHRVAVVGKLLKSLRELQNFHTLYSFVSALNAGPISRLKFTSEKLSKAQRSTLTEMEILTDMQGSFKTYREALKTISNVSCIPYIAVVLKDLTFVEENSNLVEGGLLNWYKRRLMFGVVGDFLKHQLAPHKLAPVIINADLPAAKLIADLPQMAEGQQYDTSQKIEPRGAKLEQLQ